jgi:formate dehydrogenase major subunit
MSFEIIIDGKNYKASEGETILAVADRNYIKIPTLCFLKELKPFTSCFICAVEVEGRKNLAPACSTPVSPLMNVTTNSDRIRDTRKMCLELLLSDHCGDCMAPCQAACPAGLDISGFIHLLLENRPDEAIKLIKETIPLPAALGRVCPAPCEEACRRQTLESPVSICCLKRYVGDQDLTSGKKYIPETKPDTGKKVAIIGAGPAGLSAAFYLRQAGHSVTIFDAHPKPGGMLRYGIPAYRLPRDILDAEIGVIEEMGAKFEQNKFYGKDFDFKYLKDHDFHAVFIAVGAQASTNMGIPGEEEGGMLAGTEFLADISKGAKIDVGERVVVVGGGNTAIDAARTCLRMKTKEVIILYRRTHKEMPANEIEIAEAEKEGVKFHYLAAPVSMNRTKNGIDLLCIEMELGKPDSSGRRRPTPIKGSEFTIKASTIISAIGQKVDVTNYEMKNYNLTRWNTIDVNPSTFETSVAGVFAGGDCVSGADVAVRALAMGKKISYIVDQYLGTGRVIGEVIEFDSKMGDLEEVPEEIFADVEKKERVKQPAVKVTERVNTFEEVELGFDYELALQEARRCLGCGCSSAGSCKTRELSTEYKIEPEKFKGDRRRYHVDDSHPNILYESHKCILCGNCIRYLEEVKEIYSLGFVKRGFETIVRPPLGQTLAESYPHDDASWVDVCPSGALSRKGRFTELEQHLETKAKK